MTTAPEDEAEFCEAWLANRLDENVRLGYKLGAVVHAGVPLWLPFVADEHELPRLLGVHAACLALIAFGWSMRRRRPLFLGAIKIVYAVFLFGYVLMLYYVMRHLTRLSDAVNLTGALFAYIPFCIRYSAISSRTQAFLLVALGTLGFVAMQPLSGGATWATIFSMFLAVNLVIRVVQERRLEAEARREFRFRSQVAPAHIVRHAVKLDADLQEIFRSEMKFCVCLSSDWRNYQELTANLAPAEVAAILNEYYDLCHDILRRQLPQGNYFSDWIADELFVAIYAAEGDASTLVDTALAVALEILEAKRGFAERHGLPRAVDVGLAAGEALVGLMGPARLRKATAVGEVPGRARRMQTAGKLLRLVRGEADRVVFGHECLMRLRDAVAIETHALNGSGGIADLKDTELYFAMPEVSPNNAALASTG